jgi:hypothetical protein
MTQAYTLGMAMTLYGLSRLGDDGGVNSGGGQGAGNRWSEAEIMWLGGMRICFGSVLSVFMMGGEDKAVLATAAVGLVALLLYSAAALLDVAVSDAFRFGDDIANYDSQVMFGMWGLLSIFSGYIPSPMMGGGGKALLETAAAGVAVSLVYFSYLLLA